MRRMTGLIVLALAAPAVAQTKVAATTATLDFSYVYPDAAARIAPLRRWLDIDRARLRKQGETLAAEDRSEAKRSGAPFHQHEASREWKVVTETPRLLSLSSVSYAFTGGAHGYTQTGALVWDKRRARRVDARSLFLSGNALQRTLGARWCQWLRHERARRLNVDVVDDPVFPCPPIAKLTLLLGSSDRHAIDRIGLVADQYVAGAYVEGTFEMTVPVTPALLAIVRPEWREAFAAR